MKQFFRFFTLLAVAVVTSTAAWAVEVPTPKFTPLQADVELYIYHVGTQRFLGWGEAWGTQSCVTESGLKYILKNKRDDGAIISFLGNGGYDDEGNDITQLPDGQYWLYSPDISGKAGHSVDRWQDGTCGTEYRCSFADQTDWDERGVWQIASVGNDTYTLQVPQGLTTYTDFQNMYVEGQFAGASTSRKSNAADPSYGLYSDFVYTENPEACQFKFVTAAEMEIYKAKQNLAELIDQAKEAGLSTSQYEAVVSNTNATLDEVKAAIAEVEEALRNVASYLKPSTLNIINGNCGFTVSMDGWTTSASPSYENNCWEFWNNSGQWISQTITNMPAGLYRLKAEAYTRTGMHGVLEFGDASMEIATVGSDVVNNRSQGNAWFNAGNGMNVLVLEKSEPGDITIKLTADSQTSDYWIVWRSFNAMYYGAKETDYRAYSYWETDGYEDLLTDKYYTQAYVDAIEKILKDDNEKAMNKAEAQAVAEKAKAAMEDLKKNIELLDELVGYATNDNPYDNETYCPDADFEATHQAITALFEAEITKTNEELEALRDEYLVYKNRAIACHLDEIPPGTDLTYLITNASFVDGNDNSSFTGWHVDSDGGFQNNAGSSGVVEQWNGNSVDGKSIDVWQEIQLTHVGAYSLKTKGWYRSANGTEAYNKWASGDKDVIGFLYASYSKDKFHNVFEHFYEGELTGGYVSTAEGQSPNNVTAANWLFNNTNDWDMEVKFLSLGEPTKIGILGQNLPAHAWIIWDDFVLTYIDDDLDTMREVAEGEAQAATDILDEGNPMSNEAADALRDCVEQIHNAANKEELLEAYKHINEALDVVRASIANYKRIDDALNELNDVLNETNETARPEAQDAADDLLDDLYGRIADGTIADDEIDDILAQILKAKRALLIPKNYADATDDNLIDFTRTIDNPTYSKLTDTYDVVSSLDGWTNVDGKVSAEAEENTLGVAEGYATSFDIYQEITDLPEGTYLVKVDGLFRLSNTTAESKLVQYNLAVKNGWLDLITDESMKTDIPEYEARGEFYANGDVRPFARWNFMEDETLWDAKARDEFIFSDGDDYYAYVDSLSNPDNPTYYYFPNMRRSFYARTAAGYYENEVNCYVDESGVLRIGARNLNAKDNDWVPFTNWRLYYRGTESKFEEGTGVREINAGNDTIEAVFSIDGRQQNTLQKGLNIVKTKTADGKVLVKKILVK